MRLLLPALPLLLLQLVEGSTYTCTYTSTNTLKAGLVQRPFVVLRGGARAAVAIDDDSDDEEIDLDDEDETELDPKLTKAAMKSTTKSQSKRAAATKQAVSSKLKTKTYKKKKGGLLKALKVPYIIRACMNPFTVFAMTRAYFASLFNLNYLKEDNTQGLRSAMEEKAKAQSGSGGGRKGKRQMRPGQAKTLSDLPQLSA